MHITYAPEDDAPQTWEFDPGKVRASVAEVIEKRYGGTFDEFQAGVQQGQMRARRVLLWHLLTRQHATLRFEDTPDFYADSVKVQYGTQELERIRDAVAKAPLDTEKRDLMLAGIDSEMAEAAARDQAAVTRSGKAN